MKVTNKEITAKIVQELIETWDWTSEEWMDCRDKITAALDLKDARIKRLEDALRFYGDPENWIKRNIDSWETSNPREYGDSEIIQKYKHPNTDWTGSVVIGGKRARQALGGE